MLRLDPRPVIIPFHALVKGVQQGKDRIVIVEASNEEPDLEGDVILQKALLDSADSFVKNGHLDIDHISEIGATLEPPIPNPESFIVGKPLEVIDMGGGRTAVKGILSQANEFSPEKHKYDMLWENLTRNPPVAWRASIYGFPIVDMTEDCAQNSCSHGATRYLVKGLDWRSLAFTRHPVNDEIKGNARVISSKAFIKACSAAPWSRDKKTSRASKTERAWPEYADIFSGEDTPFISSMVGGLPQSVGGQAIVGNDSFAHNGGTVGQIVDGQQATGQGSCPANVNEMFGEYLMHISRDCPAFDKELGNSIPVFIEHYMTCRGLPYEKAEILAHALMYVLIRERGRKKQ